MDITDNGFVISTDQGDVAPEAAEFREGQSFFVNVDGLELDDLGDPRKYSSWVKTPEEFTWCMSASADGSLLKGSRITITDIQTSGDKIALIVRVSDPEDRLIVNRAVVYPASALKKVAFADRREGLPWTEGREDEVIRTNVLREHDSQDLRGFIKAMHERAEKAAVVEV